MSCRHSLDKEPGVGGVHYRGMKLRPYQRATAFASRTCVKPIHPSMICLWTGFRSHSPTVPRHTAYIYIDMCSLEHSSALTKEAPTFLTPRACEPPNQLRTPSAPSCRLQVLAIYVSDQHPAHLGPGRQGLQEPCRNFIGALVAQGRVGQGEVGDGA